MTKPTLCPHCNCMTKTIKSLCGKCGGSKKNTLYIEELAKKHQKAFPKDFYLWSEHGWWLKQLTKTIESEKEKYLKGFIKLGYGKRCKEYEEGCPTCDEWKLFDEYINKLKK